MGRFPLPDLVGGDCPPDGDPVQTLVFTAAESSIGDVGDAALTVQLDLNSTCDGLSLSAPDSAQSTGKDDPQAPGWTKRYVDFMKLSLWGQRGMCTTVHPWK